MRVRHCRRMTRNIRGGIIVIIAATITGFPLKTFALPAAVAVTALQLEVKIPGQGAEGLRIAALVMNRQVLRLGLSLRGL